ncbi:Protein of unknown function DUF1753, Golgi [Lasallia pustulata]|uniref:DUF1753-domain-containing protein n=1 Tax=Lasallia pustulata TaxID=136370 RepID=A0A1W5CW63_9LECA|nr:Protein of unknown function DUF1753, Golgi [Lasallia pustulata]
MALLTRWLRLPRPKTFLYLMSLRTGTELITLSLLLNKVSGFYGLLAILTGLHLSPLQLSMYIYSLLALFLVAFLAPHIRSQSPFQCLALAWFYVLDSIINAAYTAVFGITWFLVISQHHSDKAGEAPIPGAGGSTIGDTAGFTSPKFNVSAVEVAASPAAGLTSGQDAVAVGIPADGSLGTAPYSGSPSLGHGVLQPESMSSVIVIVALWAVRVYFILIVLSYARFVLRQYIATRANVQLHTGSADGNLAEDPFARHMPEGHGWKGRVGRAMVGLGRGYWLGSQEEDAWMMSGSGKFRRLATKEPEAPGVVERERRRRSGTGPPAPPPQLQGQQGQHLRVQELQEVR